MNSLYLTESIQKYWLQMLYKIWGDLDAPNAGDFVLCLELLC